MRHDYEIDYSYQPTNERYQQTFDPPDHHHHHMNPVSTMRRFNRLNQNITTSSPFHQAQQQPFIPEHIAHLHQPHHIPPKHQINSPQHHDTHVYENIPYYFGEDTSQLGCYPDWPSPAPTPHLWPPHSLETTATSHATDRPATLAFEYGGRTRLRSSIKKLSGGDLSSLDSGAPQSTPRTPSLPPTSTTIKRTPCDSLTSDDSSYLSAKDEYHSSMSVSRSSSQGRVRFSPEASTTQFCGSPSETPVERRLSAKRSLFLRRESASPKLPSSLSPAS